MQKKKAKNRKKKAKSKTQSVKAGRKTVYRKRFNDEVYKLCLLGVIDTQIADFFDVSVRTINTWKLKHPTFLQSIKRGKISADAQIAHALFHRARGYVCPETKVFCVDGSIVTYDILKVYPPDPASMCFWLKNRAGWKDKKELLTGPSQELVSLLDIVDGKTKGMLPESSEELIDE